MDNKFSDIDMLLSGILKPQKRTLKDLFDNKLSELKISATDAFDIMEVQSRTMKGILNGSQKQVDVLNLIKLSHFLQISKTEVIEMYVELIEKNFPTINISSDEIQFINENFDLTVLKKAGVIDNIRDFKSIRERITARLGLRSIFEYKKPTVDIAFSSGSRKVENNSTRAFWISAAQASLSEIRNPNNFDREALIRFFPKIRWYTTNVQKGLLEVSRELFDLGVTVLFQPSMLTLQLRGATFNHNGKPSIILTNYQGFYSTLWFALIHELYHVLFDWEEIKENKYHLTDDSNEKISVRERELEADNFAKEYLFSEEKMKIAKRLINDETFISEFACENQIHKSLIYAFHAFNSSKTDRSSWARARFFSPNLEDCQKPLDISWYERQRIEVIVPTIAHQTYNTVIS